MKSISRLSIDFDVFPSMEEIHHTEHEQLFVLLLFFDAHN
jgi:hypothetical protein